MNGGISSGHTLDHWIPVLTIPPEVWCGFLYSLYPLGGLVWIPVLTIPLGGFGVDSCTHYTPWNV